ncbi:MAG: SURF1 family protein [Rhodospirillales bacterium]
MTLFGRPFRPRLWTSVASLLMFLVLIGLGTWQTVRLDWKQDLIDERQARWASDAVVLPQEAAAMEALMHRRVEVSGRYLHDRELYLPGRSYKGTAGVGVVTPFILDDGRAVMIYRGWVPTSLQETEKRADSNPEGRVTVEGVVLPGGWQGSDWVEPGNNPDGNVWFFINPPEMAEATGVAQAIEPIYLGLYREDQEASLPFTPPPPMEMRNDHLQYAITWFALAAALIVIYVIFHLGPKTKPEEPSS